MRLNKFFMMSLAAFALASCSNDELPDNGNQNPADANGQKTWAMLNFTMSEEDARAAGGSESPKDDKETNVKSIDLYIFDENDKLELSMTVDGGLTSDVLAPATPVEVTSGKKTFCVILNKCGKAIAAGGTADLKGTSLADFLGKQQTVTSYADLIGTEMMTSSDHMMMTGVTKDIILHSGISKEMVTTATTTGTSEAKEANNVITMNVDRNVAKLDLKMKDGATSLEVKAEETATKVATLQGVTYQVNNLHPDAYYFMQAEDENHVYPTPSYDVAFSSWPTYIDQESTQAIAAGATGTIYLTPNTHVQNNAKVGNTTYTLVSGVYTPEAGNDKYIVSAYDATNHKFTYASDATGLQKDQKSIFSYDYSVAFTSVNELTSMDIQTDENLAKVKAQLQALVAKRVAEKYTAESGILSTDVEFVKDEKAYDDFTKTTASKVYAYLVPETYTNGEVKNKEGHYTIVMKRWSMKAGETAAVEDESFKLTPLSIGIYDVVEVSGGGDPAPTGLKCFYRINTFTVKYQKADPMYYSVIRNYSYHVTINSVAKIGDTTAENVDLPGEEEQGNPIEEATTFMQCSINIYKWTDSKMDVDLGK